MAKRIYVLAIIIIILLQMVTAANAQGDEKQWLFNQINSLRSQLGLYTYAWNDQLAAAAQQHSQYMADTGHISHQQSNGSMPADRAAANGYSGDWIIENIYGGYSANASHAWNFWINSPVHYASLTNRNVNEVGVGIASSATGRYYTLVFGRRTGVSGPPAPPPAEDPPSGPSAPAPTQVPYQPPPPPTQTFTPSPTIPTFTPTVTWTYTPTWTPTASSTSPPITSTPIVLPTAAAVAQDVPANSPTKSAQTNDSNDHNTLVGTAVGESSFNLRDWLPYLLVGQVILIVIGAISLLGRRKL